MSATTYQVEIKLERHVRRPRGRVCRARKPPEQGGGLDRSAADFAWCLLSFLRGKDRADVRIKLLEVSESAAEKSGHYIDRTLDRAWESAAGEV